MNGQTFSDGTRLWDPSVSDFLAVSDKVEALAMNSSGTPLYSTRINTPTVNQKNITSNGFQYGAQDMYRDLYTELYDACYSSACDIVLFEYDWREHPYDTALKLNNFINDSNYGNVTFVSHSMGGIVSSFYLSLGSTQCNHVKKHISVGTPYLGAAKMANVFVTGNALTMRENIVIANNIRNIIGNIPSIYALFPYEQYWNSYAESVSATSELITSFQTYSETMNAFKQHMPNWNNQMMQNASNYNTQLFLTNGKHITTLVDSYYIVGKNVSTINHVTFICNGTTFSQTITDETTDGDGTVTLQSSTIGGSLDSSRIYYRINSSNTDATHTEMVKPKEYDETDAEDRANKIAQTAIPQIISLINS